MGSRDAQRYKVLYTEISDVLRMPYKGCAVYIVPWMEGTIILPKLKELP